jgi:quercetin dioxygenase-like cupin family protein
MKDFPEFMKNEKNRIDEADQNTKDVVGYFFEGADGSQMAFWTVYADRHSKEHMHDFDEYMICVCGEYTVIIDGKQTVLHSGDEFFIPKRTWHGGKCVAGTRTIHAFGGKRIHREKRNI